MSRDGKRLSPNRPQASASVGALFRALGNIFSVPAFEAKAAPFPPPTASVGRLLRQE